MGTDKTGYFGPGSVYHPGPRGDGKSATLHQLVEADRNIDRDVKRGLAQEAELWQLVARIDAIAGRLDWQDKSQQARWAVVDQGFTQVAAALVALGTCVTAVRQR